MNEIDKECVFKSCINLPSSFLSRQIIPSMLHRLSLMSTCYIPRNLNYMFNGRKSVRNYPEILKVKKIHENKA